MFHPVKSPSHYAGDGKVECRDALRSMLHGSKLKPETVYWWGCALKYLWRWPWKNGRQDVEKCKQCLDYMIESEEDGNGAEG